MNVFPSGKQRKGKYKYYISKVNSRLSLISMILLQMCVYVYTHYEIYYIYYNVYKL